MKIINLKNGSKFGKYADIQVFILPLMVLGMLHGFFDLIYAIINVGGILKQIRSIQIGGELSEIPVWFALRWHMSNLSITR